MNKLCFVANLPKYALGGAERQAMFIADAMSKRAFDVHVITASTEERARTVHEANMTIHELRGVRSGRVPTPVDTALQMWEYYRLVTAVNADVYYQRSSGALTGVVAAACRNVRRPLVFGSSHLWDATLNLDGVFFYDSPLEQIRISGRMYRYGASHSRVIIAQTEQIASLFRTKLPKSDVRCIRTPVLSPIQTKSGDKPYVVSIARLVWYKRPQAVLKVARMLPEVTFVLAGYGEMESTIREESAKIPNLTFLGRQSPEDALRLMREARVFLNTSEAEGFPNTLSESLSCETPYVSFYDPDEVICRYGLGAHVHSLEEAAAAIRKYVSDEEESRRTGVRGREYLLRFHNPDSIARQYETLFAELSKSHR